MNTARQNIEAAFSPQGTAQIPAVLCYEGIYIRDHWRQLTSAPWWHAHSPELATQLAWRRDVMQRSGHGWFEAPGFYSRQARACVSIEVSTDGVYCVDRCTGRRVCLEEPRIGGWSAAHALESIHPKHLPQSFEQIDALIPLAREFDPTDADVIGRDDLARALMVEHRDRFPLGYVAAPLWQTYHLWGFEGMMTMIASSPDLVRHACDRYLAQGIQAVRMAAWLGAAAVWIEDCLTDLISPDSFTALNAPYVRQLAEEIRIAGMKSIHYFCGNPVGKWEALLSTGIDALALEESKKGFVIDMDEVVDRVNGRCALLGNLDAIGVLQDSTEADLRAEIARQVRVGRRNHSRFIMSIGSPVTPGTPVERVRLYCDLVHELGC